MAAAAEATTEVATVEQDTASSDEEHLGQTGGDDLAMSMRLLKKRWVTDEMTNWPIFEDLEDEVEFHRKRSRALCHFVRALKQSRKEQRKLSVFANEQSDRVMQLWEEVKQVEGEREYWRLLAESAQQPVEDEKPQHTADGKPRIPDATSVPVAPPTCAQGAPAEPVDAPEVTLGGTEEQEIDKPAEAKGTDASVIKETVAAAPTRIEKGTAAKPHVARTEQELKEEKEREIIARFKRRLRIEEEAKAEEARKRAEEERRKRAAEEQAAREQEEEEARAAQLLEEARLAAEAEQMPFTKLAEDLADTYQVAADQASKARDVFLAVARSPGLARSPQPGALKMTPQSGYREMGELRRQLFDASPAPAVAAARGLKNASVREAAPLKAQDRENANPQLHRVPTPSRSPARPKGCAGKLGAPSFNRRYLGEPTRTRRDCGPAGAADRSVRGATGAAAGRGTLAAPATWSRGSSLVR